MKFKSGDYEGKTTEQVLLTAPDWAQWNVENYPASAHSVAFKGRMVDFDKKPFTIECNGTNCKQTATRATAYSGGDLLYFWCNSCNPISAGAQGSKLSTITKFSELLRHVDLTARGSRDFKRRMVRQFAEAKGLPKRVTGKSSEKFFE